MTDNFPREGRKFLRVNLIPIGKIGIQSLEELSQISRKITHGERRTSQGLRRTADVGEGLWGKPGSNSGHLAKELVRQLHQGLLRRRPALHEQGLCLVDRCGGEIIELLPVRVPDRTK